MILAVVLLLIVSISTSILLGAEQDAREGVDHQRWSIQAQEFLNYKNIVKTTLEKSSTPAIAGTILDGSLAVPNGYNLPAYERGAIVTGTFPDSWVVVWARQDGGFFDAVYQHAEYSAQLCQIDSFNDCISPRFSSPILSSSDIPTSLRQGDSVYAWKQ